MHPDHVKYLENLKSSGFEPRVIYDIGACVMEWTEEAKRLWPEASYVLFEAFPMHEAMYQKAHVMYHMGVLSDVTGKRVKFYYNTDVKAITGNSYYQERKNAHLYEKYLDMEAIALDDLVEMRGFPLPDLVKIDVQGSEQDVIQGGIKTLANANHLIVEMQKVEYNKGAPLVSETLPWIESRGWKCVAPLFADNGADGDYGFVRHSNNVSYI